MVNLLLAKGANINAFDKKDSRAVHWAAYMGETGRLNKATRIFVYTNHTVVLKYSICGQESGYSLRCFCCRSNHEVQSGGMEELKNLVFCSVLPSAGHLDVVCLLVEQGAEISCKDKRGYTPLHAAASSGQIAVVKHLLSLSVEVLHTFASSCSYSMTHFHCSDFSYVQQCT